MLLSNGTGNRFSLLRNQFSEFIKKENKGCIERSRRRKRGPAYAKATAGRQVTGKKPEVAGEGKGDRHQITPDNDL